MQLCMLLPPKPDRQWRLARQLGVEGAILKLAPELTGKPAPFVGGVIAEARDALAGEGLALIGLEGDQFDMSAIKLGLPGRERDLDRYCDMLRHMGAADVRLLCYNFMAGIGWYRTASGLPGRGGALVSAFDQDVAAGDPETPFGRVSSERMWENLEHFHRRVVPVAEAVGVKLALHPDDPPVSELRGISRILISGDAVERALNLVPSPASGVTFCQATFHTMGEDVAALARRFSASGKLFFIHIRNVRGTAAHFLETFPEEGDIDLAAMFELYRTLGFTGPVRPDHAPAMAGSVIGEMSATGGGLAIGYEPEGMIYTFAYMRGLLDGIGQTVR